MTNLALDIITNATMDTPFEPFPHNLRQRLRTRIIVVDEIPKKYRVKKMYDLDFWNDILVSFMQMFHMVTR